jgi:hypothetical protein
MISSLLVLPLEVYIIRDIAQLYHIDFVISLSKEVLFGMLILIALFKINVKDKDLFNKENKDEEDGYGLIAGIKSILRTILVVVVLLLSWWVAYIVHSVNHL